MDGCAYAVVDNLLQKGNVGTTVIRHLSLVICSGKRPGTGNRERGTGQEETAKTADGSRQPEIGVRDSRLVARGSRCGSRLAARRSWPALWLAARRSWPAACGLMPCGPWPHPAAATGQCQPINGTAPPEIEIVRNLMLQGDPKPGYSVGDCLGSALVFRPSGAMFSQPI